MRGHDINALILSNLDKIYENVSGKARETLYEDFMEIVDLDGNIYRRGLPETGYPITEYDEVIYIVCQYSSETKGFSHPTDTYESISYYVSYPADENILMEMDNMLASLKIQEEIKSPSIIE